MNDSEGARTRAGDERSERPGPRLEALEHDLALSREIRWRLDGELRRLESKVAALEAEAGHLRGVLSERETYLQAIQGSFVWRCAQALRRLVGRAW